MSGIIGKREVRGSGVVSRPAAPVLSVSGSTGAVSDADIDHDSLTNFASNEHYTQANITALGTVTSGTISTGAVIDDPTMTQGSDATGDVYYRAASGKLTRLATGADGTVLTSTGAGSVPAFEAPIAAGSVVKWNNGGDLSNSGTISADGTFGTMAITISSTSNDVLLVTYIVGSKLTQGGTTYSNLYIQGGGFGTGADGEKLEDNLGYGDEQYSKHYLTPVLYDSTPGSTSFNYEYYFDKIDANFSFYRLRYYWAEIKG